MLWTYAGRSQPALRYDLRRLFVSNTINPPMDGLHRA